MPSLRRVTIAPVYARPPSSLPARRTLTSADSMREASDDFNESLVSFVSSFTFAPAGGGAFAGMGAEAGAFGCPDTSEAPSISAPANAPPPTHFVFMGRGGPPGAAAV